MGRKRLSMVLMLPAAAACWAACQARGEEPPLPPLPQGAAAAPAIPLEVEPEPLPPLPPSQATPTPTPTPQSAAGAASPQSGPEGPEAMGRLRNPYQWDGGPEEHRGLFGQLGSLGRMAAAPASPQAATPYPAATGAAPTTPGASAAPGTATAAPGPGPGAGADAAVPGFGGGLAATQDLFPMIGDMSPYRFNTAGGAGSALRSGAGGVGSAAVPPPPPGPRASQLFYPSVRVFKASENQSPKPQDRVYFNFNNFYDVNRDINRDFKVPVRNITAAHYFMGVEKTFNEGKGSLGIRLPVDNLAGVSTLKGFHTPGSTSTGDLTVFGKYVLEQNRQTGSLVSVGLAITPPTGPAKFAGAPWTFGLNSTYVQPFLGFIWNHGNFYAQGFSAFDFPVSVNDVALMYNDVGFGYYLIKSNDPTRLVTGLAPTFEMHVNTPLNHRQWYNPFDLAGSADVVNLTYGVNVEFRRSAVLSTALVTPVTSPKPFAAELAVMLNIYYGRTRASRLAITPPPVF